jgi:GNAT superfamily N-acetyltransferase
MVAQWCVDEWPHLFPEDTVRWYLDMYGEADTSGELPPHALVAIDGDEVVGTASLVPDDELPDANGAGPWVAAVYVVPGHRRHGVGRALLEAVHARITGDAWLYTEGGTQWYESMGWTRVRESAVNGHRVTVMHRSAV